MAKKTQLATINLNVGCSKIAFGVKARQPPYCCQKPPPHVHWRQQPLSPADSPLNCSVSFLLGPDTICTNAPSCSVASLWSGVQVTFLPAKALGPPQPQPICKLFTLHFPHLDRGQGKSGTRPTRKNQQIGPRLEQERKDCVLGWSGILTHHQHRPVLFFSLLEYKRKFDLETDPCVQQSAGPQN